jgi:hypothetical protein
MRPPSFNPDDRNASLPNAIQRLPGNDLGVALAPGHQINDPLREDFLDRGGPACVVSSIARSKASPMTSVTSGSNAVPFQKWGMLLTTGSRVATVNERHHETNSNA